MDTNRFSGSVETTEYFLRNWTPKKTLCLGCGLGGEVEQFVESGSSVVAVDILPEGEFPFSGQHNVSYIEEDIMMFSSKDVFDCVYCSHLIEHIGDTQSFLKHFFSFIPNGGKYCIIWPRPKPFVVGGHLHVFNHGLLLYNLVRAGIDCRSIELTECDYSLAIMGEKKTFELPDLKNDSGDIEVLSHWFPFDAVQGFDGDAVPGLIALKREWD